MSRGRPREFDPEAALDQALAVFARDGFEQASVQELADAMGICKPSLYAAYGNKESLYIEALRRYAGTIASRRAAILDGAPDGASAVQALMRDAVESYTTCTEAAGCLIVSRMASTAAGRDDAVRQVIVGIMTQDRAMLEARLLRALHDGELSRTVDIGELTTYFGAVLAGLSVQARGGVPAAQLHAVARTAMQAWVAASAGPASQDGADAVGR